MTKIKAFTRVLLSLMKSVTFFLLLWLLSGINCQIISNNKTSSIFVSATGQQQNKEEISFAFINNKLLEQNESDVMLDKVDEQQYNSQSSVATDVVTITDDEEIDIRQLDNNKEISYGNKIVKNADGSVFNPLASDDRFVYVFNIVCFIVGLFASARVIQKQFATCRNDGWRPRHVLLMGNIVSCILTLCVHCFMPILHYVWPNDDLCCVFVVFYRLPYILFLFNLFMSIMDRYVAITRSVWHRTKLTINHCVIWLSFLNGLLAMAVKWSFLAQMLPVECAFQFIHGLTILVTILVLFILCTAFLIAVFVITWPQLPRAARAIPIPTLRPICEQQPSSPHRQDPPINPAAADIEYVPLRDLLPPTVAAVENVEEEARHSSSNMSVIHSTSSGNLRRMELLVTKHFLVTLIPLFAIVVPCLVLGFTILVSRFLYPQNVVADALVSYLSYIVLLPTIHVTIYPVANLLLNKEISYCCSSAFFSFSFCRCLFPCQCHQQQTDTADQQRQMNDHGNPLFNRFG